MFRVARGRVETTLAEAVRTVEETGRALDASTEGGPVAQRVRLKDEIATMQGELDAPQRAYAAYMEALGEWEARRKQIVGDATAVGSLGYLEHTIEGIAELPKRLCELKEAREALARRVFGHKERLANRYRELYQPVQQFIEERPQAGEQLEVEFHVSMEEEGFAEGFLAFINQGRRGSFHGSVEGLGVVREMLSRSDFGSADRVMAFVQEVMDHLSEDRREGADPRVSLGDQLKQGKGAVSLYDYVFSLGFLEPRYVLRWQGKELHELSPGERGTVLLVFYLLVDRSDTPIVIDQPEENLDNQTIYNILVPCVKEARSRRQVVMVTHNPNLAVVCDADQVIHAEIDREDGNRVTYTAGAIENPDTNQRIVDILEGTRPAFANRERKYEVTGGVVAGAVDRADA